MRIEHHHLNFRHVFAEVRELAVKGSNEHALQPCSSLADAWFMDLRDTAVTNLAAAGCTIPEICSITGHTERSAYEILKHYLALNGDMADAAIAKLVAYMRNAGGRTAGSSRTRGLSLLLLQIR